MSLAQFYPWQTATAQSWLGDRERFAHAWLIHGPEGIGKLNFCLAAAAALLCSNPHNGLACGQCESCHWLSLGNHMDFRLVLPDALSEQLGFNPESTDKEKNDEIKLSNEIRIEQVRQLEEFMGLTTHQGGLRVVVLGPAEAFNTASANAILKVLEEGKSARILDLTDDEKKLLKGYQLLSTKPIIYVANVSEEDVANDAMDNELVNAVREFAKTENSEVVVISAQIEQEISELDEEEEKQEFLEAMGIKESGVDRLIRASYSLLGLMSFLTTGEVETRAWTIEKGTKAVDAAGKIHTDISRGFIRAEIVSYDDLVELGSMAAAREKGLIRLEGKDYIMQDGDVVHFRFNV